MPDKIYCAICEEEIDELPYYDDESQSFIDQEGKHYETLSDWYNEVTALWNESDSTVFDGIFICRGCVEYAHEQIQKRKDAENEYRKEHECN